jgi:hypothetical protein
VAIFERTGLSRPNKYDKNPGPIKELKVYRKDLPVISGERYLNMWRATSYRQQEFG